MYWMLNGRRYDDEYDAADRLIEDAEVETPDDDEVEEYINEVCDDRIDFGARNYYPGEVVRLIDEDTFDEVRSEMLNERIESERDELIETLRSMDHREETTIYGIRVVARDEDEDEEEEDTREDDEELKKQAKEQKWIDAEKKLEEDNDFCEFRELIGKNSGYQKL